MQIRLAVPVRHKADEVKAVVLRNRVKVASKRKGKKYKMKNNRAAVSRWLLMGSGYFKRAQAGARHLNRKNRRWKKKAKRFRVTANSAQSKLLKKLIPYWRRKYMRFRGHTWTLGSHPYIPNHMPLKLNTAHVVITGASGGVGGVAAKAFLEEGARVSLQYNSQLGLLQELLTEYPDRTFFHKSSVESETEIADFFKAATDRFGTVTSLVVCHGIWPTDDIGVKDMTLERWRKTISVNLDGSFLFCREYLRQLDAAVKRGESLTNVAIVFVGSTAGKFGEAWHADYSSSKSALMYGLTLSLKNEIVKIHPRGRVNTVSPGWIRTPMAERAMNDVNLLYQALASSPLKKVSEPIDVANAILFLTSEAMSGNITGISLDVNAGMEGRLLNKKEEFA
ncbi:hypothetical protein HDU96_005852 [Phlyctochytrium bullatum]|nr:hypothetical protein HDU96_005852 [Phlyctochytrium bullatum]